MEQISRTFITNRINIQQDKKSLLSRDTVLDNGSVGELFRYFSNEGCEEFYSYIEWLGISKDPNIVLFSSTHHYYIDNEDLKSIRNIVHLTPLNHFSDLKGFMHSVFHLLPEGTVFIGCFIDASRRVSFEPEKHQKNTGSSSVKYATLVSRTSTKSSLYTFFHGLLDIRTNRKMTKRSITLLLEDYGFKILDMTELNGITYFCTRKFRSSRKKVLL